MNRLLFRYVGLHIPLILGCLAFGLADACRADDGAIEAVGGTLRLMEAHPSIHMDAEFVHARVSKDSVAVECVFFLRNDGPAATVTVGFPNTSDGDVVAIVPYRYFASYVDGQEVDVRQVEDPKNGDASAGMYRAWMVKEVAFEANQVRCLRNVYVALPGMSYPNYRSFEYILQTGGSWAGPIGVGDVVITLDGIEPDSLDYTNPAPTARSAHELRWHFEKLEPDARSKFYSIHIAWRE